MNWASGLFFAAGVAVAVERKPVIWTFLGYPFEAAGMIAVIFGCICARLFSASQLAARKAYRWTLDVPISAMTFGAAVGLVIDYRPEPLSALLLGAGVGTIGEGLFRIAESMAKKFGLFGVGEIAPSASQPTDQPQNKEEANQEEANQQGKGGET